MSMLSITASKPKACTLSRQLTEKSSRWSRLHFWGGWEELQTAGRHIFWSQKWHGLKDMILDDPGVNEAEDEDDGTIGTEAKNSDTDVEMR